MDAYEFEPLELNEEGKPYNIRHRCYHFSKQVILFIKGCQYEKIYRLLL